MKRGLATVLCAALTLAGAPARAEIHALIMGFEKYQFKQTLTGSRNDALDLAGVLRRRGVTDLTVLDDAHGTKADVEAVWAAMSGRAKPGDVLFVSFSGHGNKSPEVKEPKHTPDGWEKGFLLPAYDEEKNPEEQLRDEHLYDLFKVQSDRGVKIVLVTDACHSGASVRAIVPGKAAPPKFQRFETHGKPLPPPPAPSSVVRRPPISGLTIYSATDEALTIQEFLIDGQKRGALSYAMGRGLEGNAAGPDGVLTEGELGRYVVRMVRERSENTQIPSAVTPDPDFRLFATAEASKSAAPSADSPPSPQERPPVRAKDAGVPPLATLVVFTEGTLPSGLNGVSRSTDGSRLNLGWSADGQVTNAHGDVVASGVGPNALQEAVDARRVLDALIKVTEGQDGQVTTGVAAVGKPGSDRYYLKGELVRLSAESGPLPFLTVVDLTADGTVQVLYPQKSDPLQGPEGQPWSFDVRVTPPYGQDTLVVLQSDRALTDLHATLAGIDGRRAPISLYDALRLWLPQAKVRVGLQSIFTCETLKDDGSCASAALP
ncbi:MAG: caspase family protein [Parafilimonas terrae]|nr:caspase family protein [Parafilimonas terrae]